MADKVQKFLAEFEPGPADAALRAAVLRAAKLPVSTGMFEATGISYKYGPLTKRGSFVKSWKVICAFSLLIPMQSSCSLRCFFFFHLNLCLLFHLRLGLLVRSCAASRPRCPHRDSLASLCLTRTASCATMQRPQTRRPTTACRAGSSRGVWT
eukprot:m.264523 g.264523  ORF g.264523 m.264523 type:complete len:153 (-) comp11053_c2_seq42:2393-2851(-)